jgi:hypothetical protein
MPVLIALAGFVVFLCVFGMRGLKIAGAVFGVAGAALLFVMIWSEHVSNVRAEQSAAYHASCPLCGPPPR